MNKPKTYKDYVDLMVDKEIDVFYKRSDSVGVSQLYKGESMPSDDELLKKCIAADSIESGKEAEEEKEITSKYSYDEFFSKLEREGEITHNEVMEILDEIKEGQVIAVIKLGEYYKVA